MIEIVKNSPITDEDNNSDHNNGNHNKNDNKENINNKQSKLIIPIVNRNQ